MYIFNLSSFTTVIQFLGHTFMALNRFTLIWFPLNHAQIWKKRWYIFVLLSISLLTVSCNIHQAAKFNYLSDERISIKTLDDEMESISYGIKITVYICTTTASAVLNVLAVIKLYFYKQTSSSITVSEKKLFSLSFVIFLAQCLRLLFPLAQLFSSNKELKAFSQISLPFISDIYALSGSVTLLILSETTRKEYLKFYFPRKFIKKSFSSTPKMFPTDETAKGTVARAYKT